MPSFKLTPFFVAAAVAGAVSAQQSTFPATPLASRHFEYTALPYQVDTDTDLIRGRQYGFNQCNSTTENQDSNCQVAFLNTIEDFCLWAPPEKDSIIADTEGEEVAWCSKPGHGTRVMPPGTLQGVQYMRTPDYVQVVGFLDQSKINIKAGSFGGELDPHGADLRGNPLGGVVFSDVFSGQNGSYKQVIEWHNFMGGEHFCLKLCDPAGPNAAHFCEHIFDRIGCEYNAPNNAQNGTFEVCKGDNQDFPGVYTENGQTLTFTQPAESLGAITSIPYQPKVPASSECTTFSSDQLYASAASYFASSVTGTATSGLTLSTGASGTRSGGSTSSTNSSGDSSSAGTAVRSNGAFAGAAIAGMGMVGALAVML